MDKIIFVYDGSAIRDIGIGTLTFVPRVGELCQIKSLEYKVFGVVYDYDQREIRLHITK